MYYATPEYFEQVLIIGAYKVIIILSMNPVLSCIALRTLMTICNWDSHP